ncbi:hypothetical protein JW960_07670 [candidate division KSB1 bacterium]|nr:hypothetical protein [candidate division KSB1 bacterium]
MRANKQDLCYITVEILDSRNNFVPYADNLTNFEVKGKGSIAAVRNSNPVSIESFRKPYRKAYEGRC